MEERREASDLRFCCLDDPIYQLKELEQGGGIKEYYEAFDPIQKQVDLPEEFLLSWFVAGLKSDTRRGIQSFRPKTVREAYVFGRLYEATHPPPVKQSSTQAVREPSLLIASPIPTLQDSSTSLEAAWAVVETSEEKQAPTSSTIGKEFQSTEPEFQRATNSGKSSTCRIVESLEFKGLRGNLISVETRNREDELKIVETLPEIANRDEYKLETKEFGNSVPGAHKLFDEMPRRSLEPVLEGEPTVGCVVDNSSFRESLVHLSMGDMLTFDPGGQITAAVKLITLDLSRIESHVLVQYSTKLPAVYAPTLFEEMPDLKAICSLSNVLKAEVGGRNNHEVFSISESFDHVGGLVKLVFDPGGQVMKEVEEQGLNWSGNERACHENTFAGQELMSPEFVMSTNEKRARAVTDGAGLRDELFVFTINPSGGEHKVFTELADLLLEFESFTPIVFDPGGSFLLFKCRAIQRQIWNGNLQQLMIQDESVYSVEEIEICASCGNFIMLQWDPGGSCHYFIFILHCLFM